MNRIIIGIASFILLSLAQIGLGQTANLTKGCVPLKVAFDAPNLSNYYWDFNDGASSDLKKPDHLFTNAGIYKVELYEGTNGALIGTLDVEVFPDPALAIVVDSFEGCLPLTVTFKANVTIHPDIKIDSYLWTFGDGNDSTEENPSYTYRREGDYDVSLKLFTNFEECDKVIIEEKLVRVQGITPEFTTPSFTSCTSPANFDFENLTHYDPLHQYHWNFGQGDSLDIYDPEAILYAEEGDYVISLSITTETGCVVTSTQNVRVGAPLINLDVPNPICTNGNFTIENLIPADIYSWEISPATDVILINSDLREANFTISEPGDYDISYRASTLDGCETDTSFTINVGFADAGLSGLPEVTCADNFDIILTADSLNYTQYIWSGFGIDGDTVTMDPSVSIQYEAPERDSFYLNAPDSLRFFLLIGSESGCTDQKSFALPIVKPDAYFIPDSTLGFCPLSLGFNDVSYSDAVVASRLWDFGDGEILMVGKEDTVVQHIYEDPGIYDVHLTIIDVNGCSDRSELVEITVIKLEPLPPNQGTCNATVGDGGPICTGVEYDIEITGAALAILDAHIDTDESRFDHCWKETFFQYTFLYPGIFETTASLEYEGLEVEQIPLLPLLVSGAHAEAEYRIDCDNPYVVEFWSESMNATEIQWILEGEVISDEEEFSHRFEARGDYKVYLQANNAGVDCDPHLDSVMVYIREIHAEFELEDVLCANSSYILDASKSMDVDDRCHMGYRWEFEQKRPRTSDNAALQHKFERGHQQVILTTEDINGCKDTHSKTIDVYGIDAAIAVPELICLPHETQLLDLSEGDTTIVAWQWSIGSTEQNPDHTFTEDQLSESENIFVELTLTDAAGCEESTSELVEVYEPETNIVLDGNQIICSGVELQFTASDISQLGFALDLDWDFDPFEANTNSDSILSVLFDQSGVYTIYLNYEEAGTSCLGSDSINITVIEPPTALFSSSHDSLETICYPETLQFQNESTTDGQVIYTWNLGNGQYSNEVHPSTSYNKGDYEVRLITSSIYGCSDVYTKSYRFIGPEGTVDFDEGLVCLNQDFTLEATDLVDVTSITWDFGDGTIVANENPITHQYTFNPPGDETIVQMILQSDDTGCEYVESIPINLSAVFADFALGERTGYCAGTVSLDNLSNEATDYTWTFNNQQSTDSIPVFEYDMSGPQEVTLQVLNNETGCESSLTQLIDIEGLGEDFEMPNVFSPNGDGLNDFFTVAAQDDLKELVQVNEFKVYNRWGNLIYDNDFPGRGWDGSFEGKISPNEVYAYYIEFIFENCGADVVKGNVTVVR